MRILAIETSCDETAISIVEADGDLPAPCSSRQAGLCNTHFKVLGNQLLSQIDMHREYGGVYPNLAKREHSRNLVPLLQAALEEAGIAINQPNKPLPSTKHEELKALLQREPELYEQLIDFLPAIETPKIDAIAVTYGPGLEPALWVGINFAKALALVWNIPVTPVNHMEGHIFAALLKEANEKSYDISFNSFPSLALLISGAHTELVLMKEWGVYELLGSTRDDAVGEAFDKVARMLGLPYPGGPEISKLAETARHSLILQNYREESSSLPLPRPMINSDDLDFSFSGLKTAVLYRTKEMHELTPALIQALALEFENAVTDVLAHKTSKALEQTSAQTLIIGGGVSANTHIRERLQAVADERGIPFLTPLQGLSTDNALMIAIAGWFTYLRKGALSAENLNQLRAHGDLRLA